MQKKRRTTHHFSNPYRPGAGHRPPHLAGRQREMSEFNRLLQQDVILENLVLTGLRGVGKTVLLDELKPIAQKSGWLWVGTDLSEVASLSDENIAIRLITDLSVVTSKLTVGEQEKRRIGFQSQTESDPVTLNYNVLLTLFNQSPGLISDKLKAVLETVWSVVEQLPDVRGIIFAYDEAQNLADHAEKNQYPLSLLLDTFQSLQKKEIRFMLVLTGLPTLFPKLVEARTFAERMFRVVFLDRLDENASREAIEKPIEQTGCPITLTKESVDIVVKESAGYPYFIQFICREVYDVFLQGATSVPIEEIQHKLDTDFFAGRWTLLTDRQRELLTVIAWLDDCDNEFTIQKIVDHSKISLQNSFSTSHASQMLQKLSDAGLVYKNRHGHYSLAVPLLSQFIRRQPQRAGQGPQDWAPPE